MTASLPDGAAWSAGNARETGAEPPPRTRVLLLVLVLSLHGLGVSLAMNVRVGSDTIPPGILQVQWIAGEPSGPPAAEVSSGEPEAPAAESVPEPPAPEPEPPTPEPEPEPPVPEPEPEPPPPEPIPEPPVIPEPLAEPEPEVPVVAPPPPPPPEKPRPPKRPKPSPTPSTPKPAPAPKPASVPAAPGGVPAAAPLGPAAAPNPGPPAGAAQSGAKLNSEYVEPSYQAAYLSNPRPAYPSASRRMEEEGKVTLRVHITADGQADQVLLHQGSGFERLDRAAMEAVRRWRFVPARRGRENVPGWVMVPIQFSLGS